MPENYAGDCINLKDYQPIILLTIVDTLIYSVTSFVTLPEKSQDAIFLKIPLFIKNDFYLVKKLLNLEVATSRCLKNVFCFAS